MRLTFTLEANPGRIQVCKQGYHRHRKMFQLGGGGGGGQHFLKDDFLLL